MNFLKRLFSLGRGQCLSETAEIAENEIHCKRITDIQEIPDNNSLFRPECCVMMVVDGKEYHIKADLEQDFIKHFSQYRKQSKYYTHIPNKNEVALPFGLVLGRYGGDIEEKLIEIETKAVLGEYKFFVVPKEYFFEYIKAQTIYEEKDALLKNTTRLNNEGITLENDGKIDEAIATYEECCALGYPATHSYNRLIVLYHKKNDKENEIKAIKRYLNVFGEDKRMTVRLQKLEGTYIPPNKQYPTERLKFPLQGEALGDKYERAKTYFGEFNFYANGISNDDFMQNPNKETIWEIRRTFKSWMEEAETCERQGDFCKAATIYEKVVANHFFLTSAYDRLVKIYAKAKLPVVKDVLEEGISYFTEYRDKQKSYVLELGKKYGALDFALERINNNKKITYYNGAFELYNPYNILDKWHERLLKIK